jgi:hypothetical protein
MRLHSLAAVWIGLWFGAAAANCQTEEVQLTLLPPNERSWIRLDLAGPPDHVYELLASPDLVDWRVIGTTHDGLIRYPDAASLELPFRYYRARLTEKTEEDDWKNQIRYDDDPFRSWPTLFAPEEIRWIKFAILTGDPYRVYFQDSSKYLFHYDFASVRLKPFQGMSRAAFDQVSLHLINQQVVLGTVLLPPEPDRNEYGIQFVGLQPYPRETIEQLFHLVSAVIVGPENVRPFYMPVFEQGAAAQAARDYLESRGIPLGSPAQWLTGDACYVSGWALGRIRHIPPDEIQAAYMDGRLQPGDILVTDAVPSEVPFVAGIIALSPSTPNSHVAILARSYGVPFFYPADEAERDRILSLVDSEVIVLVQSDYFGCSSKVIALDENFSEALRDELLELKRPPTVNVPPTERFGAYSASAETLEPADTKFFGGKAANFGVLRRVLPTNSPPAIAFSFDLWEDFMAQPFSPEKTLGEEIHHRLSGYTYPPNMASVQTNLAAIRRLITRTAQFNEPQRQAIISALGVFDPNRKIRFRSSSNAEDDRTFTGAGLYDSYSGCLLDDLDGDGEGPSHCDPNHAQERGVFRAIQRVYASFYNDNAFLERLRHGINEAHVGMALLVHHSTPDEIEMANGVATFTWQRGGFQFASGDLVTQEGAVSVTNPSGNAQPEIVEGSIYSFGSFLALKARSSLVPLGGHVLGWEEEYRAFVEMFARVADAYETMFPEKSRFILNFEYKKVFPGRLEIKQVRELPLLTGTNSVPFLIDEPLELTVFQGEFADVFANHRLKSQWQLQTRNIRLGSTNLLESIYSDGQVELLSAGELISLTGPPSSWPNASFSVVDGVSADQWALGQGRDRRSYSLDTELILEVSPPQNPIVTQAGFNKRLVVNYASPVPALDYMRQPISTTREEVMIVPRSLVGPRSLLQHRVMTLGALVIESSFYWPEPPKGIVAGYTAPLIAWVETTIAGLTAEPIVLRGFYSQTYRPEHHNFSENFIFEPRLEPGLPQSILDELQGKDIQLIYVFLDRDQPNAPDVRLLGFDGRFREPK